MIAGQGLDLAKTTLASIREQVKEHDIEALCKRNEFGKHVICSRPTYFNYMNGKGSNQDLYNRIHKFLKNRIEKRN